MGIPAQVSRLALNQLWSKDGLELPILLTLPPECWDDWPVSPCSVYMVSGIRHARQALYLLSHIPSPSIYF